MDRGAWWATVHGVTRVIYNLVTKPPQNEPRARYLRPIKTKMALWTPVLKDMPRFVNGWYILFTVL